MFMPNLLRNFLYARHNSGCWVMDRVLRFVASELHCCANFSRKFFWSSEWPWQQQQQHAERGGLEMGVVVHCEGAALPTGARESEDGRADMVSQPLPSSPTAYQPSTTAVQWGPLPSRL